MYYLINGNSEIYAKSEIIPDPELENYCISDTDLDLTMYTVTVGMIDENKNLIYPQQRVKPAEQLVQKIISMRQTQIDTDVAALELDYRLTLLENNVKEGETE